MAAVAITGLLSDLSGRAQRLGVRGPIHVRTPWPRVSGFVSVSLGWGIQLMAVSAIASAVLSLLLLFVTLLQRRYDADR